MRRYGLLIVAVLLGAALYYWRQTVVNKENSPSIRVGVDHSPPFYLIGPDGSVTGLAVDVLNEAARRKGVRLIWVPLHDVPLDDALRHRTVQMWPLVGSSASRKSEFYLSRPWLESDYVLVSRQEHPVRSAAEAAGQTIAHARLRTTTAVAHQYLARSNLIVRVYRADAVQAVCREEAAAALVESRTADAILLSRPAGCESLNLHMSTLAGVTSPLSIAAVPEIRRAAEALRSEITRLSQDGYLMAKLDEWSPFSVQGARSIWAEEAADQRSRIYRFSLVIIGVLALVLAGVAHRAGRLKDLAERAGAELRDTQRRFAAFMDHSPAVSFMKDAQGRVLYVNRAWSQMFGRSPEECYGKTDFALWPPAVAHQLRATDLELLAGNEPRQWVEQVPVAPDDTRAILTVKFPFASESGERYVGGTGIDITERQAAIERLAASEARYRELFEQNPLPAWVYDRETLSFLTVNDAAVRAYGWSREDFLTGMRLPDIEVAEGEGAEPTGERRRWTHTTKEGFRLSVDVTGYELEYEGRQARLMIVSDVTEQERMLEQLRLSEERWQLALRGAGDALWDWDIETGRVFRSPSWRAMLGYDQHEIGESPDDLINLLHPEDRTAVELALASHLERRSALFAVEYRLRHKNGTWRWIMDRGQAVWDARGRAIRIAGSHTDVTERKAVETLLAIEASTDPLTGLLNRREFDRRFADLLAEAHVAHSRLVACICDLDRFKDVNDTYGHAMGDRVLAHFGSILRQNLRKTDLVARVGGDEFLLALPGTSGDDARAIIERVREQLHSVAFEAAHSDFHVTSSFGVAELREAHHNGADLLADADAMLYSAKHSGRNRTMAA